MMTASAPSVAPCETFAPILDPTQFPSRDHLIRHLVGECNWSRGRVARYFRLSERQVRRLTEPERLQVNLGPPAATSPLTPKEIETMARDYASDPYSSIEDREAALGWVAVVAQASGVEELGRIKFGRGIRVPAKPRIA